MSRDIAPFGLRMPPDLKKRVEDAARASGRSLNAEICQRLEQSFTSEPACEQTDIASRVKELEAKVTHLEQIISNKD